MGQVVPNAQISVQLVLKICVQLAVKIEICLNVIVPNIILN